jgi:2-phospho-L-lactate guanylyltransferase
MRTSYTRWVDVAVLVPVKAFTEAKQRLASVLNPTDRIRLARWLADGVVASLGATPVFVVCDDPDVRRWADDVGATVLWTAQLGLNGAVDDGVTAVAAAGFDHVVVTHADLPLPDGLVEIAREATSTFVPDRRRDGTNVMSFPTASPISAQYGPGSFRRHRASARTPTTEVRFDHHLSIDLDNPSDLTHPLLREVLPTWLPTIPANHFTHRRP